MTRLWPGQKLIADIELEKLLYGMDSHLPAQVKQGGEYCVQFKFRVYTDAKLTHSVEKESSVTCTSGYRELSPLKKDP